MTPDGTPIVGLTRIPGLFVNTGHGTLGWTMAAGSGRMLADLISGTEPEIAAEDLGPSRYARPDRARGGAPGSRRRHHPANAKPTRSVDPTRLD